MRAQRIADERPSPGPMGDFSGTWEWTKAAASSNGVRETGCYITLDTSNGAYGITARTNGNLYANTSSYSVST